MFGNPIGKKANGNLYELLFIHFRFDAAMFDKYHAIDNISTEYSLEKVELEDARKALDDIEAEKEFIIEKQLKLEQEERAAQLLIIRRNVAAKVIQRAYRNYLARKLLKKKKKKKKAAASQKKIIWWDFPFPIN